MSDLLADIAWDDLDIDHLRGQSYKDFHAKGLDYVCLHRSDSLTLKAYFFAEGMDSQKVGEVVNPHDHRYHFTTQLMSGVIRNKWFMDAGCSCCGEVFQQFNWMTPLNGGNGFSHVGEVRLLNHHTFTGAWPGCKYEMSAHELHTIEVGAPETCIVLAQYEDVVPVTMPTWTFTRSPEPPSLKGLYGEFSADELVARVELLRELQAAL